MKNGEKNDSFRAYTADELDAIVDAEMDEWTAARRAGLAEYDPEANAIRLHVFGDLMPYMIDLDFLKTPAQLLNMIFHLSEKSWCKDSVLTDFIHCLAWTIRERHDQSLWAFYHLGK